MPLPVFDNELGGGDVISLAFEAPGQPDRLPDLLPVDLFLEFGLIGFDDE